MTLAEINKAYKSARVPREWKGWPEHGEGPGASERVEPLPFWSLAPTVAYQSEIWELWLYYYSKSVSGLWALKVNCACKVCPLVTKFIYVWMIFLAKSFSHLMTRRMAILYQWDSSSSPQTRQRWTCQCRIQFPALRFRTVFLHEWKADLWFRGHVWAPSIGKYLGSMYLIWKLLSQGFRICFYFLNTTIDG